MKKQKSILCYGDSNTWGYVPCSINDITTQLKRFDRQERWPGLLQIALGEEYYVIEEGLNSRTTNIDTATVPRLSSAAEIPIDRNGMNYLPACLYSHAPIDLVILALGGNDLKTAFNRSADDVKAGLNSLIDIIKQSMFGPSFQSPPKILIISQPPPLLLVEEVKDENNNFLYSGMVEKAKLLIPLYAELAKESQSYFLDISRHIKPSQIDGVHYDKASHGKLAEIIFKEVVRIFAEKQS